MMFDNILRCLSIKGKIVRVSEDMEGMAIDGPWDSKGLFSSELPIKQPGVKVHTWPSCGTDSVETLLLVISLKATYPLHVFLHRGISRREILDLPSPPPPRHHLAFGHAHSLPETGIIS
jgi:hypothetical protein